MYIYIYIYIYIHIYIYIYIYTSLNWSSSSTFSTYVFQQNVDAVLSLSTRKMCLLQWAHRHIECPGSGHTASHGTSLDLQNRSPRLPRSVKNPPGGPLGAQHAPRRHPSRAGRIPRTPQSAQEALQKRPRGVLGRPRGGQERPRGGHGLPKSAQDVPAEAFPHDSGIPRLHVCKALRSTY